MEETNHNSNKIIIVLAMIFGALLLCFTCCIVLFLIGNNSTNNAENDEITEDTIKDYTINFGGNAEYFSENGLTDEEIDFSREAEKLDKEGKYDMALTKIDTALASNNNHPALFYMKAYILGHTDRIDEAIEILEKLHLEYPNAPFVVSQLSYDYFLSGDCEKAEEIALKMAKIDGIMLVDERILYGNAGIVLAECESDSEQTKIFLEKALERSTLEADKLIYQEYLDTLL